MEVLEEWWGGIGWMSALGCTAAALCTLPLMSSFFANDDAVIDAVTPRHHRVRWVVYDGNGRHSDVRGDCNTVWDDAAEVSLVRPYHCGP